MKPLLLIAVCFAATLWVNAQQNTVAAFGNAGSSSGSISFSVGQIDFTSLSNTSNAGVQQSFDNSISLPSLALFCMP